MPSRMATGSAAASWLVASISTSQLMVSIGGPLRRRILLRSASSPTLCGLSERVIDSGLYCSMMVPSGIPVVASSERIAPLRSRGEMLAMARSRAAAGQLGKQRARDAARRPFRALARPQLPGIDAGDARDRAERTPVVIAMRGRQIGEARFERTGEAPPVRAGKAVQRDAFDADVERGAWCRLRAVARHLRRWRRVCARHAQPLVSVVVSGFSIFAYSPRAAASRCAMPTGACSSAAKNAA